MVSRRSPSRHPANPTTPGFGPAMSLHPTEFGAVETLETGTGPELVVLLHAAACVDDGLLCED